MKEPSHPSHFAGSAAGSGERAAAWAVYRAIVSPHDGRVLPVAQVVCGAVKTEAVNTEQRAARISPIGPAAAAPLWTSQASDGGVRDHIFLGTPVTCVDRPISTEIRMGGPPIAYSVENGLSTQGSLCDNGSLALCLLRDLSCSQAPPVSPTRATLALVFSAGWGQTRHVDRPTHPQYYGYVAG